MRPVAPSDLPRLHQHWTHPAVREHLWDNDVITRDIALGVIERSVREFQQFGYGLFAAEACDDQFAGCFGLRRLDDDAELIYSLEPALWGRGLAFEGSRAIVRWAFECLHLPRVLAGTDEPNTRSLRVIERLGMKPAGRRGSSVYFVLEKA
jgi:RimJ/RimL family protein N-acetyltransferase